MSHFAVLVVGDDFEEQLAPFNEQDAGFFKFIDETDELRKHHAKYGQSYTLEKYAEEEGYETRGEGDNKRYGRMDNPNAHWDWYSVGGRWTGFFPVKKGCSGVVGEPGLMTDPATQGTADIINAGGVDIERAREEARKKAETDFDKWAAVVAELGMPKGWEDVLDSYGDKRIPEARRAYHKQEAIRAMDESQCPVKTYGESREAYVRGRMDTVLVPYAYLRDGKWCSRGKMGWFGVSDDSMTQAEWNKHVHEMYASLDPATTLTLVDCHI